MAHVTARMRSIMYKHRVGGNRGIQDHVTRAVLVATSGDEGADQADAARSDAAIVDAISQSADGKWCHVTQLSHGASVHPFSLSWDIRVDSGWDMEEEGTQVVKVVYSYTSYLSAGKRECVEDMGGSGGGGGRDYGTMGLYESISRLSPSTPKYPILPHRVVETVSGKDTYTGKLNRKDVI